MTRRYVALLRGVNVGGKNKIPMSKLRVCLEALGFQEVTTYIASGNVLLKSDKTAVQVKNLMESMLSKHFRIDSQIIGVLVLTEGQFKAVVAQRPTGFGEEPAKYHSDVIFLMGVNPTAAMAIFSPREGVDQIWKGKGVIYSQRVSALRTKSRLNQIMGKPEYKSMTIRNWNTTTAIQRLLEGGNSQKIKKKG